MKKIVIVAGDKSGDLYGGFLCEKLKAKNSNLEIYSFGGSKLAKNSKQLINLLEFSVTGLVEVLFSLKKIIAVFDKIVASINEIKPDLVILIDFPDFNLRLAKKLKLQYPLFYYVSPQVWAWRKERLKDIKKFVDKMVVLFKFEEEFYQKENMQALYFGHPLLEIVTQKNIPSEKIISFMPGSRKNEIKKHLPIMQKVKWILQTQLPDYSFRIIRPENIEESFYKNLSDIDLVRHSYEKIEESKFIIASSGTATVEIGILEVPFLVMYKVNPLTWAIIKKMVNLKFAAMVNILSGMKIIDEFLQDDATAENIAKRTLEIVKNDTLYGIIKQNLKQFKQTLLPTRATEKFSAYLSNYLKLNT